MADRACIDASVVLQIVTQEDQSEIADALWASWLRRGGQPIAPPNFSSEVCSVLRQKAALRNELSAEEEEEALDLFFSLDILILSPQEHLRTAWDLARELNLPTVYDTAYLGLAQAENCEFWTADRRFYNAAHSRFDRVHWLGDFQIDDEISEIGSTSD